MGIGYLQQQIAEQNEVRGYTKKPEMDRRRRLTLKGIRGLNTNHCQLPFTLSGYFEQLKNDIVTSKLRSSMVYDQISR